MESVQDLLALLHRHLDLLLLGGVSLGLILLVWVLVLALLTRARLRSELGDQRALLREVQADIADDVAQSRQQLQESLSAGLMRLQEVFDHRINSLQRQMLQDSAALKTDLIDRFETQRKAIGDSLADGRLAQQRESSGLRESLEAALNRHREVAEQHAVPLVEAPPEIATSPPVPVPIF